MLNYTQSRQFDLLKNLGFDTPSWQDLAYLLIGVVVFASLLGAGWTLWERSQHDPWLRLLERCRRRLRQTGLALPPASPPREMAVRVRQHFGPAGDGLADWLLQLESQRYAPRAVTPLNQLRRQFKQLTWPT